MSGLLCGAEACAVLAMMRSRHAAALLRARAAGAVQRRRGGTCRYGDAGSIVRVMFAE